MQRRPGKALAAKDNLPKLIRLVRILDLHVGTDEPTTIIPVTSLRGFKGHRIKGVTEDLPWEVELWGSNFYIVKIQGFLPADFRFPLYVLNFLLARIPHVARHRGSPQALHTTSH